MTEAKSVNNLPKTVIQQYLIESQDDITDELPHHQGKHYHQPQLFGISAHKCQIHIAPQVTNALIPPSSLSM